MIDVLSQFLAALVRFIFSNWLTGLALVALIAYLVYSTSKDKTKALLTILRQIKSGEWKEFLQTKCTQGKTSLKALKKAGIAKTILREVQRFFSWFPVAILLFVSNLVIRLGFRLPFLRRGRKRFDKELKPILSFRTYRSWAVMGLLFSLLAFMVVNYVVTVFRGLITLISTMIVTRTANVPFNWDIFDFGNLFNAQVYSIAPILSIPLLVIGLIIAWRSAWVNFEQYRDYNGNEEGDDRFATEKEVKQQYKKVPNKTMTYPGAGGFPVMHKRRHNLEGMTLGTKMLWSNRTLGSYLSWCERLLDSLSIPSGDYYIEDDTINTLGIGMTRSGKGEGTITPVIDINSRAEDQPSMIVGDPKGEHYQSSYKTMRKRGYNVKVLSYQNMDYSMSYNPLALAIAAAKKGYYEKTQMHVNATAESLYPASKSGNKGNSEYFRKSSISLFNAIVMALIDRAYEAKQSGEEDAWDTITIRNDAKYLTDLGSETVYVDSVGEIVEAPEAGQSVTKKSRLTVYFDNLRKVNQVRYSKFREMADMAFRISDFGEGETKGNVYSSMMTGINLFLQDNLAKMTSKNDIDLESIGFPRRLSIRFRSSSQANLANSYAFQRARLSITSTQQWGVKTMTKTLVDPQTVLIDEQGYLTFVIEPKLPNHFKVSIDFDHPENAPDIRKERFNFEAKKVFKKHGKVIQLDEYTKEPVLDHIAVDNITSTKKDHLLTADAIEFIYSEKPTIIYLVTPPHRTEYNSMISLFLHQLFNANYDLALSFGRKCVLRILHILDEFTNLPAIPSMDTKISIGLGQNILYYLWIQNLEQLDAVYGRETAMTIRNNCSLEVYIKSKGDTNKAFSEGLGDKTITSRRRSANIIDEANPNVSVDHKKQSVLTQTQISKLQEGEAVILRGVKNRDRLGLKVTPDPIFLHDKTAYPYSYMFLTQEFDRKMTLADIPVESGHRGLNLQDIEVAPKQALESLIQWRYDLEGRMVTDPKLKPRKSAKSTDKTYQTQEDLYKGLVQDVRQAPVPSYEQPSQENAFDLLEAEPYSDEVI